MFFKRYILILLFFHSYSSNLTAQSVAGTISGTKTFCDTINSGFLSVTGQTGNVVTWLLSNDGGVNWTSNGNTFSTQSYLNLKKTMCYKVVVKNGSFQPDTSLMVCNTIYLPTVKGFISGSGTYCGSAPSGTLTLNGYVGNIIGWESSIDGGANWTQITNTTPILSYTTLTQSELFRTRVQNSAFCKEDTSNNAYVTVYPNTVAGNLNSANTNTICYGNNSSTLTISGSVGSILYWIHTSDNGISWSSIANNTTNQIEQNLTQTTTYKAVVKSANCITDTTNAITLNVLPQNTVNAGPDVTILSGQSTNLNGSGTGVVSWLPANSGLNNYGILNPTATPITTSNYILTLTDLNSCVTSDTVKVNVIQPTFTGIISNLISPNGDGINDSWYVENINFYPNNEVSIYNINGNLIYHKKGYTNDWKGTYNGMALPDGTYYYVLKIDDVNPIFKGFIDVLKDK
jgi:gliding motility-associated-like protein